ncbi:MAG: hypothetical protein ISR58_07575 [Anaerolineales bacterium]|nr:hypothetical protein [Chloroflexota bacterium]MBL6981036.1 hypothetical protein [Anaerolineales bacterium]
MGLLKKITDFFTTSVTGSGGTSVYWLYVQCDHCGEKIKARVNLNSDLSIRYGEKNEEDTYFCRKMIIGNERCYRPIEVEMTFDRSKKLLDRQIKGGRIISEETFVAE